MRLFDWKEGGWVSGSSRVPVGLSTRLPSLEVEYWSRATTSVAFLEHAADGASPEVPTQNSTPKVLSLLRHRPLLPSQVVVCNVMTSGAGINRRAGTAKRINRQLALYGKATAPAARETKGGQPVEVVKMNNPRAAREDGRAFDGLHLNARGYRAFASAVYEAVGPMMVAVEWKVWKSKLAAGLTNGAGGAAVAPISGEGFEAKSKANKKAD